MDLIRYGSYTPEHMELSFANSLFQWCHTAYAITDDNWNLDCYPRVSMPRSGSACHTSRDTTCVSSSRSLWQRRGPICTVSFKLSRLTLAERCRGLTGSIPPVLVRRAVHACRDEVVRLHHAGSDARRRQIGRSRARSKAAVADSRPLAGMWALSATVPARRRFCHLIVCIRLLDLVSLEQLPG